MDPSPVYHRHRREVLTRAHAAAAEAWVLSSRAVAASVHARTRLLRVQRESTHRQARMAAIRIAHRNLLQRDAG